MRPPEIRVKPLGDNNGKPYAYEVQLETPEEVALWRVLYYTQDRRDADLFLAQVLVTARAGVQNG